MKPSFFKGPLPVFLAMTFASVVPALVLPEKRADAATTLWEPQTTEDDLNIKWNEDDGFKCSDDRREVIKQELRYAVDLAKTAEANPILGEFYYHFFDLETQGQDGHIDDVKGVYKRMSEMLLGVGDYQLALSCKMDSLCVKKDGKPSGTAAFANDGNKRMNFCDIFFEARTANKDGGSPFMTSDLISNCKSEQSTINLRKAQQSRAAILVHESAHTKYVMGDVSDKGALDIAYGLNGNLALPDGKLDRAKHLPQTGRGSLVNPKDKSKIICPSADGQTESVCDKTKCRQNDDSYVFPAAGVFFTQACEQEVPLPEGVVYPELSR